MEANAVAFASVPGDHHQQPNSAEVPVVLDFSIFHPEAKPKEQFERMAPRTGASKPAPFIRLFQHLDREDPRLNRKAA